MGSLFARQIPLERLSIFANNLASCWSTGISVPKTLRTSLQAFSDTQFKELGEQAAQLGDNGAKIWEALKPLEKHLPPFYLPVIKCGEQTGRLDEALRYLEKHCSMLAEPSRKIRNTWLVPLAIYCFGTVLNLLVHLFSSSASEMFQYLLQTIFTFGGATIVFLCTRQTPQMQWMFAWLRLRLPLYGVVEKNLVLNRFFHTLNLIYSTSEKERVESMIEIAGESSSNAVVKQDMLKTIPIIQNGGTVTEAFADSKILTDDFKGLILMGERSGTLENTFDVIAKEAWIAAETRLVIFNRLFYRLFLPPVMLSIAATMFSLMRALFG